MWGAEKTREGGRDSFVELLRPVSIAQLLLLLRLYDTRPIPFTIYFILFLYK